MKKAISVLLCLCLALSVFTVVPFAASAVEVTEESVSASSGITGDCTWTLDDEGTLTISGNGAMEYYEDDYSAPWGANIKTVVIEDGVTSIGEQAFYKCTGLTSVTIGNSVTSIGDAAFYKCTGLTSVTIGNSVTSIGDRAFSDCSGLSSVTVDSGNSVYDSRENCNAIIETATNTLICGCKTTTIPDSVTRIDWSAFSGCTGLTSVTIPDSVTSIGDAAFWDCTGLTSVTIPNSVMGIGGFAFYGCTGLTSVHISDIAAWCNIAFTDHESNPLYYAHDLYLNDILVTDLIIPDSVTSICDNAFSGCTGLTSITVDLDNSVYDSRNNCNAIIETATNELVFGCKTTVILDGVTSIGDCAFSGCTGLTNVTIPDSVTSIGDYAFRSCTGLTSVTIPDSVTSISNGAFTYCTGLTSVTIGNSVTSIGWDAFRGCKNLTSVTIPDSVTSISNGAFTYCTGLTSVTIGNSVTSIGWDAFRGCKNLTSVTIGNSVTSIGYSAFEGCTGLTSVTIPDSVTSIGFRALGYDYNDDYSKVAGFTICGERGSEAQRYAENNGFAFRSIFADADSYNDYYVSLGKCAFVARDKRGLSVAGCTLTVGNTQYTMDKPTYYVDMPDGFTGNVTVSKPGYLSSTLPAEYLKKTNFFVMYPDSEPDPVVQHLLLRNTKNQSNAFTDLLRSDERIYDLGNKTYDLYVGYNSKGKTVSSVYLLQGNTKIQLQSGMNRGLSINKTFSSDSGTIYICLETSDGNVYKRDSRIIALQERIAVDADLGNSISGVVDESLTGVGGWDFTGKFKLGNLPVSIYFDKNGHVKGTIGIKGDDSYTSTWYEGIKGLVNKHEKDGKTEYSNEEMEDLEKFLEDSGADVTDGYCSLGFEVSASIIGCLEGDYNWLTGRLENTKVSLILKVGGEAEYTQQSIFAGLGIPIPYYWKVAFGLELSAKIAAELGYDTNNKPKLDVSMPSLTIEPSLSGSLCLGIDKIFGGGGKLTGELSIKFNAPSYNLNSSEWKLSYKVALTGQLAGFSGDFKLKDGTYTIYPEEQGVGASLDPSISLMDDFLNSAKRIEPVASPQTEGDENAVVALRYGYANPQIATLSDGTAVMVWVDYDTQRSTANQAALYYSVLNKDSGEWSAPAQVENDGTADDMPVLKTFGDGIYLVWNDADAALGDSATMADMLGAMGVSYAVFSGTGFSSVSSVTAPNGYMDICPDITVTGGTPTVVWLKNQTGDLFGQSGTNVIMQSTLGNGAWSTSEAYSLTAGVNSFCVVNEGGQPVVYFSADSDGNAETLNDYDVFKLSGGAVSQITETEVPETDVCAFNDVAYWNENGVIKSSDGFEAAGVQAGERYMVTSGENGNRVVFYTQYNNETVSYMMKTQTDNGMSEAVTLAGGASASGGMAAYWRNDSLVLVTDEISQNSAALRQYEIEKRSDIVIEKAVYNPFTLVAGKNLHATAYVQNKGLESAAGLTVYAYNGSNLLCSESIDTLAPGERVSVDMRFDLPQTVDFDRITFYVSDNSTNVTDGEGYIMPISLTDISVENLDVISDVQSCEVSASIVNRGIGTIENAVLYLRSNSADGDVLDTCTVTNLGSREEYIYSHTLNAAQLEGVVRLYLTVEPINGEDNTVNNEDFALIQDITDTDTEIINKLDLYDRINLNEPKTITIENEYDGVSKLFIPKYSGIYTIFSSGSRDTYGYLLDISENVLISNDDAGEDSNFKITYTLEAGKAYFIKSSFYGSATGSFDVTVQADSLFGDVNLDGRVNIRDVTAIQRHIAEFAMFSDEQLAVADVDGNGVVDINDATHLQRYLAEYDVQLG